MKAATLEELIGSLLVVGIRGGTPDHDILRRDLAACAEARVKGVIVFDVDAATGEPRNIRNPEQTRGLCSAIHATLGEDALVYIDQEGGAVNRLRADLGFLEHSSAKSFVRWPPRQREFRAVRIPLQLSHLGFDCNLAPCVDVASQLKNDVVVKSERCFSKNPDVVASCAAATIKTHRLMGVFSCVKHFPGHGCSIEDSHRDLPDITDRFKESRDLAPYRALLRGPKDQQPDMVMTGHLCDRNVDPELPASLSSEHTQRALRQRLGWDGVVMTDSLDMAAVAARWSVEEAAALALNAGADLILHAFNPAPVDQPHPAPALAQAIRHAVEQGDIAGGADRLRASANRRRCLLAARATRRRAAQAALRASG